MYVCFFQGSAAYPSESILHESLTNLLKSQEKKELALALEKLNRARLALAEAKTLEEIKTIMDSATAFEAYSRAAKLGIKMQNDCAEIRIEAECKAGEFLKAIERSKGGRNSDQLGPSLTKVLKENRISPSSSKRWQKESEVPVKIRQ